MPLNSDTQELIRKLEELSGNMVHVVEDPDLKVMATISQARGGAPAHFLRYRPGTRAVDYLVAYQLQFLVRMFTCPEGERWDLVATEEEKRTGIELMGLTGMPPDFAESISGSVIVQLRTFSVGARVDDWIRNHLPSLRDQQNQAIRTQLAENERALAPEIRSKFPKPLLDANTAMNAAFAMIWGGVWEEPRLTIPFKALGYGKKAAELLEILQNSPDDPRFDRSVLEQWAQSLGLTGCFHFEPHLPN